MNKYLETLGSKLMYYAIYWNNYEAVEALLDTSLAMVETDNCHHMRPMDFLKALNTGSDIHKKMEKLIRKKEKLYERCGGEFEKATVEAGLKTLKLLFAIPGSTETEIAKYLSKMNITMPSTTTEFWDKSKVIHNAILGNNIDLVKEYLKKADSDPNAIWACDTLIPTIRTYTELKPNNWTPLMLAVGLNRVEIVKILVAHPRIDILKSVGDLDARVIARSLPKTTRYDMLALLKKESPSHKAACGTDSNSLVNSIKNKRGINCYYYHLWNNTVIGQAEVEAAVRYLPAAEMNVILSESKNVVPESTWAALKDDSSSDKDQFTEKLKVLQTYGFEFDNRDLFTDGKTPWYEVWDWRGTISSYNLIFAILGSPSVNLNVLSGHKDTSPILLALKNNLLPWLEVFIFHDVNLGTKYGVEQETFLHHVIMEECLSDGYQISLVERIIEKNPALLRENSYLASIREMDFSPDRSKNPKCIFKFNRAVDWSPIMYSTALKRDALTQFFKDKNRDGKKKVVDLGNTYMGVSLEDIEKRRDEVLATCLEAYPGADWETGNNSRILKLAAEEKKIKEAEEKKMAVKEAEEKKMAAEAKKIKEAEEKELAAEAKLAALPFWKRERIDYCKKVIKDYEPKGPRPTEWFLGVFESAAMIEYDTHAQILTNFKKELEDLLK